MKHKLIFIDTETTGTSDADRLIQVAYRTSENKDVNELYNPERKIEIGAMAIHHITEKMIQGKPVFKGSEAAIDLQKRFDSNEIFIAHNAKFDIAMVEKEGLKVGPYIDTLKVARALDTESKINSYGMQYLRYLLGIEVEAIAHDAWGDILVLEQLFYRLLKKLIEAEQIDQDEALERMIKISSEPILYNSIPFGKYKGESIEEISKKDPGYLKWLLTQKEQDEVVDEDWIHTLKHYLHI